MARLFNLPNITRLTKLWSQNLGPGNLAAGAIPLPTLLDFSQRGIAKIWPEGRSCSWKNYCAVEP